MQDEISEEAVEAEHALGENTGIVHKRLQKMVSTGTVSDNKPPEKKPVSSVSPYMSKCVLVHQCCSVIYIFLIYIILLTLSHLMYQE